jgi:hypothetical protein
VFHDLPLEYILPQPHVLQPTLEDIFLFRLWSIALKLLGELQLRNYQLEGHDNFLTGLSSRQNFEYLFDKSIAKFGLLSFSPVS